MTKAVVEHVVLVRRTEEASPEAIDRTAPELLNCLRGMQARTQRGLHS